MRILHNGDPGRAFVLSMLAIVVIAFPAQGQVQVVSAPDDYLLRITREWGQHSVLGDLQTKPIPPGDIEVRLWYGYGITYTSGIILRRESGRWTAQSAIVHRCSFPVGYDIEITPELKTHYEAEAIRHCGEEHPEIRGRHQVVMADTLEIKPLRTNADLEVVWTNALKAGILDLPPKIPRRWFMVDGFTYVLEIRQGDEYRASRIEESIPEKDRTDADRRMEAITEMLSKSFNRECNSRELLFCRLSNEP